MARSALARGAWSVPDDPGPSFRTRLGYAFWLGLATTLHAAARGAVDGGLALAAQTHQHYMDAELHRLQGEIELAGGGPPADAEARFQRALDVARAQEAKWLELRAAIRLGRLWQDRGRTADLRDLLQPVYAWFTEGFDTPDLVDAKALLEAPA